MVTATGTLESEYTKEECEREIINFARQLNKMKWWQDKRYYKLSLKLWCNSLEELLNKSK